jgi:hypothetical protein
MGGVTMTQASIGGFRLDLEKTAEKAAAFVPLPPAMLPIIFRDPELNFNHHFFQGMETLAGSDLIERIVKAGTYAEGDKGRIMPVLKGLITSGYLQSDTELTVFVKKVLSGTFDTVPISSLGAEAESFIVSANLWGFPYIEQGMQCRESDLKMWLHMAYIGYRMAWFNNFKSSGVPSFAVEGVQARYEGKARQDYQPAEDNRHRSTSQQDRAEGSGKRHRERRTDSTRASAREDRTLVKAKRGSIWGAIR